MKKMMRLICLTVIVCVVYLALTTLRGDAEPVMKSVDAETDAHTDRGMNSDADTDNIADQVKTIGQDAIKQADAVINDVVKRADDAMDNAVEQADKALADAVDSAAEGAKKGFIESLKESAGEFWEKLFP